MISDEAHLQELVFTAVKNVLNDSPDAGKCDLDAFGAIVWQFCSTGKLQLDENARYETYYSVLGKAVTIAIAFRQNCLADMAHRDETCPKLLKYLANTYGVQPLRDAGLHTE